MNMSIPPDIKKFRTAIIPGAIFLFVSSMTFSLCAISLQYGWHIDGRALAFTTGAVLMFSFAYSWLMARLFPIGFSADGIYGHSFWGRRRFVSWQEIATARPRRLGNLRWLRVYAIDGKVTWVALFQSRDTEFQQEIRRLAPPGNPVLNHL
jgi:hypothetical protein